MNYFKRIEPAARRPFKPVARPAAPGPEALTGGGAGPLPRGISGPRDEETGQVFRREMRESGGEAKNEKISLTPHKQTAAPSRRPGLAGRFARDPETGRITAVLNAAGEVVAGADIEALRLIDGLFQIEIIRV